MLWVCLLSLRVASSVEGARCWLVIVAVDVLAYLWLWDKQVMLGVPRSETVNKQVFFPPSSLFSPKTLLPWNISTCSISHQELNPSMYIHISSSERVSSLCVTTKSTKKEVKRNLSHIGGKKPSRYCATWENFLLSDLQSILPLQVRRNFPPAMRVEQMTFSPRKLLRSSIAKCGSQLGQLTVCWEEMCFTGIWGTESEWRRVL